MSLLSLAQRCVALAHACTTMYSRTALRPGSRLAPHRLAPRPLHSNRPVAERPLHASSLRQRLPPGQALPCFTRRTNGLSTAAQAAASASSTTPLSREDLEIKIQQLQEQILKHNDAYYNRAERAVSDDAYDSLKAELRALQRQLQLLAGPTPLTTPLAVGAPPSGRLAKVQHAVSMTSLEAAPDKATVLDWFSRLAESEPNLERHGRGWVVEPKVDGLAVTLQYEKGRLVLAATRGTGQLGEDVTHNAAHISGIPQVLRGWVEGGPVPNVVEVRGEVFIFKQDLEMLNKELAAAGQKPLANPRNAASGSLMLLDPAAAAKRRLSFFAYSLVCPPALSKRLGPNDNGAPEQAPPGGGMPPTHIATTQWQALEWLQQQDFRVFQASGERATARTFSDAVVAAEAWMAGRDNLAYEVDGVVLKVNSLTEQQRLGTTSGDPKWAVAWKFPSMEAVTILRSIQVNVGRTGQIVPVAKLEPVDLGVMVRNATLHNVGNVAALGLRIGDHVLVRRSGDVIPQVMRALPELRTGDEVPWECPTSCPACQGPVVIQKGAGGAETLACQNSQCSGQAFRSMEHWVDTCVKGVGVGILEKMYNAGLVNSVADLYFVTKEDLLALDKVRDKSARNILKAIDKSRKQPTPVILSGLGIKLIGQKTAEQLCETYSSVQQLADAAQNKGAGGHLQGLPGFGGEMARSLVEWCRNPANQQLLNRLHEGGVRAIRDARPPPTKEDAKDASSPARAPQKVPLESKVVLVTGIFPGLTRKQISQRLTAMGAKVASGVSSQLDLVILGDNAGPSKLLKIQKLGLKTIPALDFVEQYAAFFYAGEDEDSRG